MCVLLLLVSTSVSGAKINLQADRLSLQYLSRLSQALTRFGFWISKRKISLPGLAADPECAKAFLIDYIQSLFDHGRPFGLAKETIFAMQTVFRHLKGRLRAAWDSASSWRLRNPVHRRVPMRFETLVGLCRYGCLAAWLRPDWTKVVPFSGSLGSRPCKPGSGACFAQQSFSGFTALASAFLGVAACRMKT